MKASITIIICLLAIGSFAQKDDYSNQYIGWKKIYNFKGEKEGLKVDDKFYSAAQISIADSLANWVQASYFPKGGLGDVKKLFWKKSDCTIPIMLLCLRVTG
jgi:hypothetical protein